LKIVIEGLFARNDTIVAYVCMYNPILVVQLKLEAVLIVSFDPILGCATAGLPDFS
jgi:hypothetical protein